ncbi:MAG TPA: hypothetical protein VF137_09675 [Candidatus Dormibacteraeota bacterium]
MLSDAVRDITDAARSEARRRQRLELQRQDIRRLDGWLETVENMLEEERETVPEPLIREIAAFLREINPKLHRALLRNRAREASRVLDVLFDAQELVLPGFIEPTYELTETA